MPIGMHPPVAFCISVLCRDAAGDHVPQPYADLVGGRTCQIHSRDKHYDSDGISPYAEIGVDPPARRDIVVDHKRIEVNHIYHE